MTTIPSKSAASYKSGFRFAGSGAGKFLFTALAAILLAQTSLAADVAGTARLIRERRGHTATAIGGGRILVAGGQNFSGALADVEIFDAATGTFGVAARLLTPRAEHTATRLADGRVFLIGGRGTEALNSTEFFDPSRNVFSSGPSLNSPRFGHTATLLPDGRVVVIGGNAEGTAEIFDPRAGTFAALPCHLSEPRSFHAAVRLRDGSILIAGGIAKAGASLRSAEILHPDTLECERIGTMFAARSRFTLRMLPDGKVQAIGGDAERTMELFNPAGRFSSLAHLAGTANSESAALRNPGRVAILGPAARPISDSPTSVGGREVVRVVQSLLDRIDYSLTEVPEAGLAIAAGGVSSTGRYQQTAVLFDASAATVTTDQTDYHPGETVTITGTGWLPGETVSLNLHRDTNDPPDTVLTAVADPNGNITNSEYVCQDSDVGITFLLTATGQTSGYTAQTTFTDGNLQRLDLVPTSVTVTQGNDAVYAANVTMGGNTNACTVTLAVTTVLPTGAVATFSLPNPTVVDPGNVNFSRTLTISTTQLTPPGTYSFTAQATGTGCQGGGSNPIATGTLVVTAATGACAGQASGFVCRASAGQCDVAETCNGVSPLCPADSYQTATTSCTGASQSGACDDDAADHCTGTSNSCVDVYRAATFTCRADAGQCDVAESCTGTSGACPADVFETTATTCTGASEGGACDATDHCSGTANTCVDEYKAATVVCRADAGQCDVEETCTGNSGACPTDVFETTATTCTGASQGGACDATDHCSGTANTCIDEYKAATVVCRADAGQCDVEETCTGNSGACPADAFEPTLTVCTGTSNGDTCDATDHCSGTANTCVDEYKAATVVCRADAGQCDVEETCTGNSGACPADAFETTATTCTGASQGGACDATDHCSGTANTCVDEYQAAGFTCRASAGQCDVEETCTGNSGACPTDVFETTATSCTGTSQGGECNDDAADHCSGTSETCVDVFKANTTTCGDAGTQCTNQDFCSGTSAACTDNGFKASSTSCTGTSQGGACNDDPADHCTGTSDTCVDVFKANTTTCGDAGTQCTNQDFCSGTSAACNDNGFKTASTSCTGTSQGGECNDDAADHCSGTNETCVDVFKANTTTCGDAGTQCTNQDFCSGTSAACNDNGFKASSSTCTGASLGGACDNDAADHCTGTSDSCVDSYRPANYICRADAGQCDVAETCTGTSSACPAEGLEPNGTVCNDNNACTLADTCQAGACAGATIPGCGGASCTGNVDPVVAPPVPGPNQSGPLPIGSTVTISATFTDANPGQAHTCSIAWDDPANPTSAGTVTEGLTSGTCTGSHTYGSPGVYTVTVTIFDGCGSGSSKYEFVVIFDPSGGFVTGGGWINQPAGGYPNLPGNKANFGFVSKYKKGNNTPEGETEFQFKAGDINFHSSSYDYGSLVISGSKKATYRGDGTVNGEAGYRFVLIAIDGDAPPSSGPDRFRIKITKGSSLIYDNRPGSSEDPDLSATDVLGGGSIVIHK